MDEGNSQVRGREIFEERQSSAAVFRYQAQGI